jgi:hypothetical protein
MSPEPKAIAVTGAFFYGVQLVFHLPVGTAGTLSLGVWAVTSWMFRHS